MCALIAQIILITRTKDRTHRNQQRDATRMQNHSGKSRVDDPSLLSIC